MTLQPDSQEPASGASASASGNTGWINVSQLGEFAIICTVHNLSGTTPNLQWSVDHTQKIDDAGVTLIGTGSFTAVTAGPFPNIQTKTVADAGSVSACAKYIRINWTITGTTPVATISVELRKKTPASA